MAAQNIHTSPQLFDWVASLLTLALFVLQRFLKRGGIPPLRIIGGLILIVALILAFLPFYQLRKYGKGKDGRNYMDTSAVVQRGVYSMVRHPQYLGYMLFNIGFMLTSQNWVIIFLGALAVTFFYIHAIAEEKFCCRKFGEEYTRYTQKVPRFNLPLGIIRYYGNSRKRLRKQNKETAPS